jgi:hypothetical protein
MFLHYLYNRKELLIMRGIVKHFSMKKFDDPDYFENEMKAEI